MQKWKSGNAICISEAELVDKFLKMQLREADLKMLGASSVEQLLYSVVTSRKQTKIYDLGMILFGGIGVS